MIITVWRKSNGITQARFAELCETSEAYISQIETGRRNPGKRLAQRIEAATNGDITAAELLGLATSGVHEDARDFDPASTLHVELDQSVITDADKLGLNVKAIARAAVEEKVKAARLKAWISENQAAFDAHATDIEENGLWSDDLRMF